MGKVLPIPTIESPEILAPAGSPDCLPAAVAGGATAVYLGLRHFNARGRAANFRKADLPGHVAYLHHHGLKCYVVLNTLVHEDEHTKALDLAAAAHGAGVDAAIVQDLGLMALIKKHLPAFPVHASTQMTLHHTSQIEAMAELGASRVILARELSLAELADASRCADAHGMDIEHFVHGALCYALSGQCLMSNFAGCRSANRGTCAQNCRFVYQQKDASGAVTEDTVLSMRDFSLINRVGELIEAGVASFKIEGRLKGPDYVYTVSKAYSQAVEAWKRGRQQSSQSARDEALRTVFARPFTTTPLDGDYSAAARLRLGGEGDLVDGHLITLKRQRGEALIRAKQSPRPGQGYTYHVGAWRGGFQVTHVQRDKGHWRCRIRIDSRGPAVPPETSIRLNSDADRLAEARRAMSAVAPDQHNQQFGVGIELVFSARLGQAPTLQAWHQGDELVSVQGTQAAEAAQSRPLMADAVKKAIGTLPNSGYRISKLRLDVPQSLFVPAAQIKALRRDLLEQLPPPPESQAIPFSPPPAQEPDRRQTALWVVVSTIASALAAFAAGAQRVCLDDPTLDLWGDAPPALDLSGLSEAQQQALWIRHPAAAALSPHLAAMGLPVMAGHVGVLRAARDLGLPAMADYTCNTYSSVTMASLGSLGAEATVLSLECSAREVARLVARLPGQNLPLIAVVVHGRLPAMLTRQDHGLAQGQSQRIQAIEREGGLPYQIVRHAGNWTGIYESRHLADPEHAQLTAGLVDAWVLELADLSADAVAELTDQYAGLLKASKSPESVRHVAEAHAPDGIFSGHLAIGSRALDVMQPDGEIDESVGKP